MKIFSKNTWGVDVNNAWPLTCKGSCQKKIELRPLISGFDFALLEVRNLCVASRLHTYTHSILSITRIIQSLYYSPASHPAKVPIEGAVLFKLSYRQHYQGMSQGKGMESANNDARKWPIFFFFPPYSQDFINSLTSPPDQGVTGVFKNKFCDYIGFTF